MKKLALILVLLSFSKIYSGCTSCSAKFSRPVSRPSNSISQTIVNKTQANTSKNDLAILNHKLNVLRNKIMSLKADGLTVRDQRILQNIKTLASELNLNVLTKLIEQK